MVGDGFPIKNFGLGRDDVHGYLKVSPTPTAEFLRQFYKETYYQENKGIYEAQYSDVEKEFFLRQVVLRLEEAKHLNPEKVMARILDLGCGEGWATAAMASFFEGEVTAVDLSSHGLSTHNPHLLESFTQMSAEEFLDGKADESFDLIWADHVIEHHRDPARLLGLIERKLAPAGVAIISLPNDDSDYQSALKDHGKIESDWWIAPPDHLNYFNRTSFTSLAQSLGFTVQSVLADFPIDWYLANNTSNYVREPSSGRSAYAAKLFLELQISKVSTELQRDFYRSLAGVMLGRNFTFIMVRSVGNL